MSETVRNGTRWAAVLAAGALSLLAGAVLAHHPVPGKFDPNAAVTLEGIVTYVDWRNPHAHVFVDVARNGETRNWAIELESPIDLAASGWSAETVLPGDAITVEGILARDGSRQAWGESVVNSDTGHRLFVVDNEPPPLPLNPRPTPRWPDGQVALGATPGSAGGYWSYPSETTLVEDGIDVDLDEYGLLADVRDARRVAPMQDWALGIYRHRQSRYLQDDPMYLHCKPPGGPRQYMSNHGFQLIEDRERDRIFVLMGSGNHNYRIIYLDDRELTGQVRGDDDNPLYYGRSVGRWEGDTLVVETEGFNEDFWFSQGGLPHTSLLRMTERFSRPSVDILEYEVTIDDPGAYTRPWTASWTLQWVGGEELPVHFCQHNRP